MTDSAVKYEKGEDGIVVLTLDDPTASANTMNDLYKESMHAAIDKLYAEKDDVTGVVITSAKKTFFAGGNLKGMLAATPEDAQARLRDVRGHQGRPAPARDARQARRRGDQRRRPRWWARDHPRLSPPHRGRRPEGRARPAGGHPRPAARRRWRDPHRPDVRHPVRADGHPAPGHPVQAGGGQGEGPRRRAGREPRGPRPGREEVDPGQPGRPRRPHRTRGTATATRSPVARRPAPASRRSCPRSRRCCASRPRARSTRLRARSWPLRSKGPRSTSTRPAGSSRATSPSWSPGQQQEHDPGVLLRPLRHQRRALRPEDVPKFTRHQGRRARCRDDGRRHRLLVRPRGHGGRAQGRRAGVGRQGQGLQREDPRQGRRARQDGRGEEGRDPRPDHRHHRRQRPGRLRPRDRGGLRGPVAEGDRCSPRSRTSSNPDALLCSNTSTLPITELAEGVNRPADFVGLHFFSPVDKMPLVEIIRGEKTTDEARRQGARRGDGRSARRRSWSTTAAVSTPAGSSARW